MRNIENKQNYNAVDLLAKEIAKAADLNAGKYEYDKTFTSLILKNNTGVSSTLTDSEKSTLGECDTDYYYVRINGNFYKIKCVDANFPIDEEVRVKIPNNNWSKMYIDFRKGTNSNSWVRPSDWLSIPSDIKPNEVYCLVRGGKDQHISNWINIIFCTHDIYISDATVIVDWTDGTIQTVNVGNSASHTYTDYNWHWVKFTYNNYNGAIIINENTNSGNFVEFISGGENGIRINGTDNNYDCLEHIVSGIFYYNSSSYGSRNLQCIEIIHPSFNVNNYPIGQIDYASCKEIIFNNTVVFNDLTLTGLSGIKKLNCNKLKNIPNLYQCWNITEIYAPCCESIANELGNSIYCEVPNLKKITLKSDCIISENSCLNSMSWVEKIYV